MPDLVARTLLASFMLACATAGVATAAPLQVDITYITRQEPPIQPISLVEPILEDEGLMGARQALSENQTTGQFLEHEYRLIERIVPEGGDVVAEFQAALAAGERLSSAIFWWSSFSRSPRWPTMPAPWCSTHAPRTTGSAPRSATRACCTPRRRGR